jgi:hypothetical protein
MYYRNRTFVWPSSVSTCFVCLRLEYPRHPLPIHHQTLFLTSQRVTEFIVTFQLDFSQSVGRSVGLSVSQSAILSSYPAPPRSLNQILVYGLLNTTVRGGMSPPTTVRICPLSQPPPFCCKHLLFITYSVLRQVHSLFQSELYKQCDLALPLSISSIFPFP